MTDLRIPLLALGAVLLLGALGAGKLFGGVSSGAAGRSLRVLAGLAGAGLIGWLALPLLQSYRTSPPPPALSAPVAAPASAPTAPGALTPSTPSASPAEAATGGPTATEVVQSASAALNACPMAAIPQLPDGAKATLAQMNQARQTFQTYDAATNAYTRCVDDAVDRVAKHYGGTAAPASLENLKAFGVRAHNAAIDEEQSVAEQLNAQVHAYNTKHPPK